MNIFSTDRPYRIVTGEEARLEIRAEDSLVLYRALVDALKARRDAYAAYGRGILRDSYSDDWEARQQAARERVSAADIAVAEALAALESAL